MNAPGALTIASTLIARSQQPTGLRGLIAFAAPALPGSELGSRSWPGIDDGQSIYSAKHVRSAQLKIDLYQRVGKAFDLDLEKFADAGKMARRIEEQLAKMSSSAVIALEKSLGLDKLGLSLRTVLDAMVDPGSEGGKRLDEALKLKAGELDGREKTVLMRGLDDIGRYSPASFGR